MRILAILVLLIGVGLAGSAVFFMYGEFQRFERENARLRAQAGPQVELVKVAIATQNLRYGEPLGAKQVRLTDWPAKTAPKNAFHSIEELFGDGGEKRVVLRRMEPGEAILKTKVTGFGEKATVAALLEPGMRAATIAINQISGVAGFLLPGNRVDVYLTRRTAAGPENRLILENVEILALDQTTDRDETKAQLARTATFQLTPADAQKLQVASEIGTLTLTLRGFQRSDGPVDVSKDGESILNAREVLGIKDEVKAPEPVQQAPETIRIRRALQPEEQVVE